MKKLSFYVAILLSVALVLSSCGASNAVKGGGIGTGAGAGVGAGIGSLFGGKTGAAIGAAIGGVLGGTTGVIIGKKMDKQKEELQNIEGARIESVNEGQAIKVTFDSGILFATSSSTLNYASQRALDEFAVSLRNNPDTDVKIFGHTDSTGSDAVNYPLSQKRAEAVFYYLINRGVPGYRLESKGFGPSQPIADNNSVYGRGQNRRVEVFIYPNARMIEEAQQQAR